MEKIIQKLVDAHMEILTIEELQILQEHFPNLIIVK